VRIDWAAIHRRLDRAAALLAGTGHASRDETVSVLKARAAELAREGEKRDADRERLDVLSFSLGNETYGIETLYIREVTTMNELTPLPGCPPFVLGIMNIRGQVLSVIDIRTLFDLPQRGMGDQDRVIVLRHGGMELGILGNAILGVVRVPIDELQATLPTLSGICADFFRGVTPERMAVLDGLHLLSDERIVVREDV
jgi:purine-binding chemotaxis protein CheW